MATQPTSPAVDGSRDLYLRLLPSVLDTVHEGIEVVDASGRVVYVNRAFCRITGLSVADRVGRDMTHIAPMGELMHVLRTGKPIIEATQRAAGSDVEVVLNALPLLDKSGASVAGAVLVIRDVSNVLKLGRELYQAGTMVSNLYEKIGDLTRATYTFADLIGGSPALHRAIQVAHRAAQTDSAVLITGESGTGKELFAHAIHNASRRRGGPFLTVNCAAIPDQLLESEVFGYEKGAFTGAVSRKLGMFELAHQGTLFLDEIGEMSMALQAKLLRVLQEHQFHRLGGTRPVKVNVRILAATNVNLEAAVARGRFRSDLYFRLNVLQVHTPPLRERREDIPELVEYILQKLNRRLDRSVVGVSDDIMQALEAHDWPGNVRELENILERMLTLMGPNDVLVGSHMLPAVGLSLPQARKLPLPDDEIVSFAEMERELIARALRKYGTRGGGKRRAASALGVSLATLYNKLRKYNLEGF